MMFNLMELRRVLLMSDEFMIMSSPIPTRLGSRLAAPQGPCAVEIW